LAERVDTSDDSLKLWNFLLSEKIHLVQENIISSFDLFHEQVYYWPE
jgi:hypothetical protein